MPEDAQITLQGLLGTLEGLQNSSDDALYTNKSHTNLLKSLNGLLSSGDEITSTDAERVLRMCLQYKMDMRCAPYVLSIISSLINIDKAKSFEPHMDFLPSALAVLDFLKLKCAEDKTNHLRILSFQVLMSYPNTTLIELVRNHSPVLIDVFGRFLSQESGGPLDAKIEPFILLRLLEFLPKHEKSVFVKEGIPLWLSKVMPTLVKVLTTIEDTEKIKTHLQHVELLTAQLVLHDYFEYPEWQNFLESVVVPVKFPMCIKSLLEKGKDTWHRIWIIIIKLLKGYVTKNYGSYGTPINSMLPVVETAFKRDSTQRVRAFACWNELIINFSNETNANCTSKRVKLVMIPLKLNNAKTEDAAAAKFNTWWLLIRRFKPKLEKFTNDILVPFLHFVLGKEQAVKQTFWAGQLSQQMKKKCIEAFVEIVGHSDCCTSVVEPLNGKVITTVMLADHWRDWVYALKSAVKLVAMNYTPAAKMNIRCIWKSYMLLMTELLDNSVRRDWFNDLIGLLSVLLKDCIVFNDLLELLIDDLILPLFRDNRVTTLISSRSQEHRPMHKIVALMTDNIFDTYYNSFKSEDLMQMLEPLVLTIVNESIATPAYMIWLLDELPVTDNSLKFWTALVRTATESDLCLQVFNALLRWPFKTVPTSVEVKEAALAWYTLYNIVHVKLNKIGFDNEISKILTKPVEESKAANYFNLFALIGVLKYNADEDKMAKLEALTYEMNDYEEFKPLIAPLIDTLVLMTDNALLKTNENLAQITINCVNNVLKLIKSESELIVNNKKRKVVKTMDDEVRENMNSINKTMLTDSIMSAMKTYLANCPSESIKKEIRNIISLLDQSNDKPAVKSPKKADVILKEFIAPKVQDVKKTNRKEPSIVNTVVENGEEYVVVKSNWKFNPKKLTENQKEKFEKKRDIPALYQDLSQSQDEFKLCTWKTDSQDTSLSSSKSSKSATTIDTSEILKNMPSSDVVPTIMENILENAKNNHQKTCDNTSLVSNQKLLKVDRVATPKGAKSPRMALKDRVFRNVRNLIEKSSPSSHNEVKGKQDLILHDDVCMSPIHSSKTEITTKKKDLEKIDNISKSPVSKSKSDDNLDTNKQENQTPVAVSPNANKNKVIIITAKQDNQNITLICTPLTKHKNDNNVTNSAPPLLSVERPSRMKRKPKKFDNSLMLALKKSRHSHTEPQADSQGSQDVQPKITTPVPKDKNDTDVDQAQKITEDVEKIVSENDNKAQKVTGDHVIILDDEIIMSCDGIKDKSSNMEYHITEQTITPTTPIVDEAVEKSPEKPTNIVEVPSDKDKASKGLENNAARIETEENNKDLMTVKSPLNKIKEDNQQKSLVERDSALLETFKIDIMQTITTPLRRTKKAQVQNEDCSKNQITPLSTAVNDQIQDLNQENSSFNENILQNDYNKNNEKETESAAVNRVKNANHPKSSSKGVVQNETNTNDNILEIVTPLPNKTIIVNQPKSNVKNKEMQIESNKNDNIEVAGTPNNKTKDVAPKSSVKKTARKSRIEKELMIDMVEGHPFLTAQSEKRLTRKKIMEVENSSRRKSLAEKLKKSKLEVTPKTTKIPKEKKTSPKNTVTVEDSQDRRSTSPEDATMDEPPCSEDIIESSQDSTITTISVKSTKRPPLLQPVVSLEKLALPATQDLIKYCEMIDIHRDQDRTDIELPQNKTAEVDKNTTDLTENMDTEPMDDNNASNDVIVLDETESSPIIINSEPVIGPETQELAEADTQPTDPKDFIEFESFQVIQSCQPPVTQIPETVNTVEAAIEKFITDITQSLSEVPTLAKIDDANDVSSPFKNDNLRKQDFLNNTLEISPIKIQSPDREKKSPSPETSSDFVVIKLSSPVHSNGEPFEKHGSPEFFTEDKVSPDKRDVSPPRTDITDTNISPSSSLSLKKNLTQVRPSGRAAQMLDLLCVSSDLKVTRVNERSETEDVKKTNSTSARRNLRILYNSVGDSSELPEQNLEDADHFLKLKRALPTVTSSPSGPILKRKLIDIADEATASPASKRKRVSFHDPPVSTTISVHKYIEPISLVRSPQSSAKKRFERQTRSGIKSPKRLESAFNLDSVLSKTVESFCDTTPTEDTQNTSLDITPVVEIVKTSDLNDTDPFYPDLIDCQDPIDAIATELSSPAMRELLVKELEGKVETVGDLAKMTELEVNRLCIKAPKIKVAKKVLSDYASKRPAMELVETAIEEAFSEPMTESLLDESKTASVEMQTDEVEVSDMEIQTVAVPSILASTQTESVPSAHTSMQTDESGSKTTADIISSCLVEREDFLQNLSENLEEESIKTIAEKLPFKLIFDLLINKSDNSTVLLKRLLKLQSKGVPKDKKRSAELSFVRDHLCERYDDRDLILMCSQILQKIHDKTV